MIEQELTLSIRLLGVFEAKIDGEVLSFRSERIRALCAYLLLESDLPHSREFLTNFFWGSFTEKSAKQNLRQSLARLRQSLKPVSDAYPTVEILTVTNDYVQLNLAEIVTLIDVTQVGHSLQTCELHSHQKLTHCKWCMSVFNKIADVFRGRFLVTMDLADCPEFMQWVAEWNGYLQIQTLYVWEKLAEHLLALGLPEASLAFVRKQLAIAPDYVPAHKQMMQVLLARGQNRFVQAYFVEHFGSDLANVPAELVAVYRESEGMVVGKMPAKTNPPLPNQQFFGRTMTLRNICQLLLDPNYRWLSLVGEGGIGKTTLALAAGNQMATHFPDGVWFVSLTSIQCEADEVQLIDQIAVKIAQTLQFPLSSGLILPQLQRFLSAKKSLLILDNFEHLSEGGHIVKALLASAGQSKVLVTSRLPLGFMEEFCVPVGGLEIKDAADHLPTGAIALFIERVIRHAGNFEFTPSNLETVANICKFVAGNPLAINLAASWSNQLSLCLIYEKISQSYKNVTSRFSDVPDRHRSMQTVFENSWQLLSPNEQRLLAQMSVFQGGFSKEAVANVAEDGDLMPALLEKSLLQATDSENYTLHEMLRQFGADKLRTNFAQKDLAHRTYTKHATYYLTLLNNPLHINDNSVQQHQKILKNLDNIETATFFALHNSMEQLLVAHLPKLGDFYESIGAFSDGKRLFKQLSITVRQRIALLIDENHRVLEWLLMTVLLEESRIFILNQEFEQCKKRLAEVEQLLSYNHDPRIEAQLLFHKNFVKRRPHSTLETDQNLLQHELNFTHQNKDETSEYRSLFTLTNDAHGA